MKRRMRRTILAPTLLALGWMIPLSASVALTLPDQPLFQAASGVKPNILLTIDDSGSMRRAYVPEVCGDTSDCSALDNRWAKSNHGNALYYNPSTAYDPPKKADGSTYTTAFGAAWRNGFYTSGTVGGVNFGTTVNLASGYVPTANLDMQNSPPEVFMSHYGTDVTVTIPGGTFSSTGNTGGSAMYTVTSLTNVTSVNSVTVNGILQTNVGTTTSSCGTRPGSNNQYRQYLSGNTLVLCFRNNATMQNKAITVSYNRSAGSSTVTGTSPGPAYYYVFDPSNASCTSTNKQDNDCYDIKFVGNQNGPEDMDGDGDIDTDDEKQNFANWYSFYRNRYLTTASGASLAFATLSATDRVAWQALNTCNGGSSTFSTASCSGWTGTYGSNAIGNFTGTKKTNFYNWLAKVPTDSGTPLRTAMARAGEYLKTTGENSPWDNDLTSGSSGTHHACRMNYHILMTDGIWNDSGFSSVGNVDNTTATFPADETLNPQVSKSYNPTKAPFKDSYSDTLADVAFKYWKTDLTTLQNNILAYEEDDAKYWDPEYNPAAWQHMVNFTIGLGLTDFLAAAGLTWDGDTYGGSYPSIKSGATSWPAATLAMGSAGTDYGKSAHDLWHAAINSRGKFYSAESGDDIVSAFQDVLNTIQSRSRPGGGAGVRTSELNTSGILYETKFRSDWSGLINARTLNTTPGPNFGKPDATLWEAGSLLPYAGNRSIFTMNGTSGAAFDVASCATNSGLAAVLNVNPDTAIVDNLCKQRVAWLRGYQEVTGATWTSGVASLTIPGHGFSAGDSIVVTGVVPSGYNGTRAVTGASGDVVTFTLGSNPGTFTTHGKARHAAFRDRTNSALGDIVNAQPVYVAGISRDYSGDNITVDGKSDFNTYASAIESRTASLYVGANDGMLHAFDATGDGGNELFAYVPASVYPNLNLLMKPDYEHRFFVNATPSVSDAYLSGWKTVLVGGLGKGGKSLYALDITNPESFTSDKVMWEFSDSGMGYVFGQPQIAATSATQWAAITGNGYDSGAGAILYSVNLSTANGTSVTASATAANGLSTPYLFDTDSNGIVDLAYAGDLLGNVWKFVNSSGTWSLGNGGSPLFTAQSNQAITSSPYVRLVNGKRMVFFGTGRYLETVDLTSIYQQTIHGIWDNDTNGTVPLSNLQQQTMNPDGTSSANTVNYAGGKRGWYMNLPTTVGSPAERVLARPAVHLFSALAPRATFSTSTPSTDPCKPGGSGSVIMLHALTGAQLGNAIDANGDGVVSLSEATAAGVSDTNGDGTISASEIIASGAADLNGDSSISLLEAAAAGIVDTNGNGTISAGELANYAGIVDANGDGTITVAEAPAYEVFDTNGDGSLSAVELAASAGIVDTNGDGTLTTAEMVGAARIVDTNGDGVIDSDDSAKSRIVSSSDLGLITSESILIGTGISDDRTETTGDISSDSGIGVVMTQGTSAEIATVLTRVDTAGSGGGGGGGTPPTPTRVYWQQIL